VNVFKGMLRVIGVPSFSLISQRSKGIKFVILFCIATCQMFDKWKSEVDEKLKKEKRKKLKQERRAEEDKKDEKSRKQEDAGSAYEKWYKNVFLTFD